jgi:hypothetical protein
VYLSGGGGHQLKLPDYPVDHDFKKAISPEKIQRYQPHSTPALTAKSWLNVYKDFAWYPYLDILTEGSQIMRARYPFALYEEAKRLQQMKHMQPYKILQQGDYAVARTANKYVLEHWMPILMHRQNGVWQVDISSTYKNLYTPSPGKTFYQRNKSHPYAFAFNDIWSDTLDYPEPLPLEGSSLAKQIDSLLNTTDPHKKFTLAELLYRNAYVAAEALIYYKEAADMLPNDFTVQWTYAQRLIYEGAPSKALDVLARLDSRANALRGDALYRLKKIEAAKKSYQLAINKDFDQARATKGLERINKQLAK